MATLDTIATRFARCVELFRDPGAKEAQKAEFRALLGLLKDLPVTLTVAAGRLELNGVPCEAAALTGLIQRLDLHGVGTIALPQNPAPPRRTVSARLRRSSLPPMPPGPRCRRSAPTASSAAKRCGTFDPCT